MLRKNMRRFPVVFSFLLLSLFGCGGGGGSDSGTTPLPATVQTLQSSSLSYDFGSVTLLNRPAAKIITFSNAGDLPLQISDIELTGSGFDLDLNSGAGFCASASPTLVGGGSCSAAVGFTPPAAGSFSGSLTVSSNDPATPELTILLTATGESISVTQQIVHINQVVPDACPSTQLTAYISVTDQLGYPISGLTMADFSLTETAIDQTIQSLETAASLRTPISVALVMDYSATVIADAAVVKAMEDAVIAFVDQLGPNDQAEIIKFASEIETVQPFTAGDAVGKATLIANITEPWDGGFYTRVYDATYQAVTETAPQLERRGVIVVSDFYDQPVPGTPSEWTLPDVIALANDSGVPIFTVGIGAELKPAILNELATETGGQAFDGSNVDHLQTIYQQQAEILFTDQYALTYGSVFNPGDSATLAVGVTLDGKLSYVEDTRIITPCPSY